MIKAWTCHIQRRVRVPYVSDAETCPTRVNTFWPCRTQVNSFDLWDTIKRTLDTARMRWIEYWVLGLFGYWVYWVR